MIFFFSDPHIHAFKMFNKTVDGKSTRLESIVRTIEVIKNKANQKGAYTICAGDVFHTFSYVDTTALNAATKLFSDWNEFYFVAGNHDIRSKGAYTEDDISTSFLTEFNDAHRLDDRPMLLDGNSVCGVSWKPDKAFKEYNFPEADILIGHQLIRTQDTPDGLDLSFIANKYKLMVFGDIHKPLHYGNLLIPGSPMQQSFSDERQEHGYWTLEGDHLEFCPIKSPMFITVQDMGEVKQDDNFYRVLSPFKKNGEVPENVIVQKEIDATFRESGLSLSLDNPSLLQAYMKESEDEMGVLERDLVLSEGLKVLNEFPDNVSGPARSVIKKVTLCNFGSFIGEHSFEIQKDIFLLLGANGNGKTTNFEAIYWCLFDDTTKGLSSDEVVNDQVGADCFVRVELEIIAEATIHSLVITRYRKHRKEKNNFSFEYDGKVVQRESTKETQRELEGLLGASKEFFQSLNYFSQENFRFFSSVKDSEQKDICKALLPLSRFEKAESRVKENYKVQQAKYNSTEKCLNETKLRMDLLNTNLVDYQTKSSAWQIEHELKLSTTQADMNAAKSIHDYAIQVLTEYKESTAIPERPNFDNSEFESRRYILDQEYDTEVLSIDKEILSYQDILKTLEEKERKLSADMKGTFGKCLTLDNDIKHLSVKVMEMETEIAEARCKHCGSSLPLEKLEPMKAVLEETFSDLSSKKSQRIEVEALNKEFTESCGKVTTKILITKEQVDLYRQKKNDLSSTRQAKRFDILREEDTTKTQLMKDYNDFITGHNLKLNILNGQVQIALQSFSNAEKVYFTAANAYNPFLEMLTKTSSEHVRLEADYKELTDTLLSLTKLLETHQFWQKGFSNQGIVSFLLDDFAKTFTHMINETLLNISRGRFAAVLSTQKKLKDGDYREKFDFKIFVDGSERSYASLSGGQKARVNLSTVIVLNKLVKHYFGFDYYPFGIIILDELFTYLDEEGVEAVYTELSSLVKDTAIYVVTNKNDVKGFFANTIYVDFTKETGTRIMSSNM